MIFGAFLNKKIFKIFLIYFIIPPFLEHLVCINWMKPTFSPYRWDSERLSGGLLEGRRHDQQIFPQSYGRPQYCWFQSHPPYTGLCSRKLQYFGTVAWLTQDFHQDQYYPAIKFSYSYSYSLESNNYVWLSLLFK